MVWLILFDIYVLLGTVFATLGIRYAFDYDNIDEDFQQMAEITRLTVRSSNQFQLFIFFMRVVFLWGFATVPVILALINYKRNNTNN